MLNDVQHSNYIQKMIEYYKIPIKEGKTKQSQILNITEEHELKDAIHNKSIFKVKLINFKNSNIKSESLLLIKNASENLAVTHINLSQNFSFVTDETIQTLSKCQNIHELRSLNLSDNQITDDSLIVIAKSQMFLKLEELILYGNSDITSEGMIIFSESQIVKRIKKLDLHATSIENEGIAYFLQKANASQLEDLNLAMNWKRISDKTLFSLGISKFCKKLKILNLQDCNVTDGGMEDLSDSQNCACLQMLYLNNSINHKNNQISDRTMSAISFSKNLINLKVLQLRNTDVSSKGIKSIAVSLACQRLQILRLSYCEKIDNEASLYLQKIIDFQSLKKLYINSTKMNQQQFAKLQVKSPQVSIIF